MTRTARSLATALSIATLACSSSPPSPDAAAVDAVSDAARPDAYAPPDCSGRPTEAPSPRGELVGVLDARRNRIIAYGGNTAAPVDCMPRYNLIAELWALQLDCNSWERLTPDGGPGVRARQSMTVDTMRNRMILFGGRRREDGGFGSYVNYNDLWAFDLATDTWRAIESVGDAAPSARSSSALHYDAARDRLIVFGGNTSTSGLTLTGTGDTWAFSFATSTWTQLEASGPSRRLFHASARVTRGASDRIYVFGGTPNFDGPFLDDLWAFDLATDTWSRVPASGTVPEARFGAEMFYDGARDRLLVAFGHDGTSLGNRNDVLAFDLGTNAWSSVRPGDAYFNAPSGACMFPADFTTPEADSPERRYSFLAVQSATRGYVFGGKTDCGVINDVVSLDFASGAWSFDRPATGGEACNRTGRVGCTTLCY